MKTSRLYATTILTFSFLFILWSCSNQYSQSKNISKASVYPAALERAMKNKRYFVMKSGINLYTVTSIDLDKAKQQMTVTLDKLDSLHLAYFNNPQIRSNANAQGKPLQPEIHVYMKDSISYTLDEPHTIPVEKVARIELLD